MALPRRTRLIGGLVPTSLRARLMLTVLLVGLAVVMSSYALTSRGIQNRLGERSQELAAEDARTLARYFTEETAGLEREVEELAESEELYRQLLRPETGWMRRNVGDRLTLSARTRAVVVQSETQTIYTYGPQNDVRLAIRTSLRADDDSVSGLVRLEDGVGVFVSRPVFARSGSVGGRLLAIKPLTEEYLQQTHHLPSTASLRIVAGWTDAGGVGESLETSAFGKARFRDEGVRLVVAGEVDALDGGPAGVAILTDEDERLATSQAAIRAAVSTNVLVAVAIAVALGLVAAHSIQAPVASLAAEIRSRVAGVELEGPYRPLPLGDPRLPTEVRHLAEAFESLATRLTEGREDLRLAMAQTESAEEMLRIAVDQSLEAKLLVRDGVVAVANPAAAACFGLPVRDVVGADPSLLFARTNACLEDGAPLSWTELRTVAAVAPLVVRFAAADTLERWVRVSAREHAAGDSSWLFVSATDITEDRRLERLRAELASMISHDLRAPLTVITGYLDLLGADLPPDRRERALAQARANADRLHAMLDDLLEMTRADQFFHPRSHDVVDLAELAAEVLASARAAYPVRAFGLEAGTDALVLGERQRLHQALENLVTNAVKYSPDDEPVTVRVERRGSTTVLEVEDGGPGVPEESRNSVFDRFTRLGGAEGLPSGVGLGLYIVRTIVEAHGGTVRLADAPARGARFVVELPAATGDAKAS